MSYVVEIMRSIGFDAESYPYWEREDGCKMLEQKAQNIESYLSICSKEVKNSAFSASETAEYLRKVNSITDLLYFAAPILVLIDIILRVIALMGHIS